LSLFLRLFCRVLGLFGKPGLRLSPMLLNGWLVEAGPENDVGAGMSGQVQREWAAKRPNREPFRCGQDRCSKSGFKLAISWVDMWYFWNCSLISFVFLQLCLEPGLEVDFKGPAKLQSFCQRSSAECLPLCGGLKR